MANVTAPSIARRNIAAMARQNAAKAMKVMVDAMEDADVKVRLDAANKILDRALGKPIAMTADVTDRIDEFTDEQLDAGIADLEARIEAARTVAAAEANPPITH
jgi:hypothetical protein